MPTVFRERGIRYFFYSNEGNPREPIHIHALKDKNEAKILINPEPKIVWSVGFHPHELRDILEVVSVRRHMIESAWHDHFGN